MKKCILLLCAGWLFVLLTACGQGQTGKAAVSYDADGIVRIAYSEIDPVCERDELAAEGKTILKAMQNDNALLLSLVADSTIEISARELAGYDHLVFTNPEWIDRFSDSAALTPVLYDSLPEGIRDFLTAQMPLWTADGSVLPNGVRFYEYSGDGLLAFPVNVGAGADAIAAANPLVVMIEAPAITMSAKSFLLPLTSSGNLLFTDAQALQTQLDVSSLSPYMLGLEKVESR